MTDAEGSRRKYLKLEAIDPITGKMGHVQVSFDRMQAVGRRSMGQAKECGIIVPQVLQSPNAIFEGVGWRCYCGIPERAYHSDGSERSAYPGQVFLVFVNDEGVAYNWRWEKADQDDLRLPQNHATRFKTRLL